VPSSSIEGWKPPALNAVFDAPEDRRRRLFEAAIDNPVCRGSAVQAASTLVLLEITPAPVLRLEPCDAFVRSHDPMPDTTLAIIDSARREQVQAALIAATGSELITALRPLSGGSSGAAVYRVDCAARSYVLRIDTVPGKLGNPQRGYACMRIAADAGIAPTLHFADPGVGIAIMDFIEPSPLADFPGGHAAFMRELGLLCARLQATSTFPAVANFDVVLAYMFGELRRGDMFRSGLLEAHHEAFERMRAAYPWQPSNAVSSHNDPNPTNVLSDGKRLWLIDWEAAYCNEPLADIANIALNFDATPELDAVLLTSWLGRAPDRELHARFLVLRQLCCLYYACMALGDNREPVRDDWNRDALTRQQLLAAAAAGTWVPGTPGSMLVLGKCYLGMFLRELGSPELESALAQLEHREL
jgi:aminoglycoside phosphotransferase (APT) family kinase protein